jgi:hypothetical protein
VQLTFQLASYHLLDDAVEQQNAFAARLASGPGIAAPDDGHALLEADQRFQAALDQAIAKGRERVEAVEATVQL